MGQGYYRACLSGTILLDLDKRVIDLSVIKGLSLCIRLYQWLGVFV